MDSPIDPNTTPALKPPPGITPNFVDPPSAAPPMTIALAIMCGVATFAFAARMFTRIYVMKQFQLEDCMRHPLLVLDIANDLRDLLTIGWAFSVAFFGFIFAQVPYSIGRHQWDVNLTQLAISLQYVNLTELFYIIGMLFTKLAILTQLKSIFKSTTKDWMYCLFVLLMSLVVAYNFATALVLIFQCIPREKIWNTTIPGQCINPEASTIASGVFNFVLDLLIFVLPIYAIFRLRMTLKRKLGICAVFAIGLLACVSSLLRLIYSVVIVGTADLTYYEVGLCWTSALETISAILVACFPVMPRLYRFLRGERPAAGHSSRRPSYRPTAFSVGSVGRGGLRKKSADMLAGRQGNRTLVGTEGGGVDDMKLGWLELGDDNRVSQEWSARNVEPT